MKKFIVEIEYSGDRELTDDDLYDIISDKINNDYIGDLNDLSVSEYHE